MKIQAMQLQWQKKLIEQEHQKIRKMKDFEQLHVYQPHNTDDTRKADEAVQKKKADKQTLSVIQSALDRRKKPLIQRRSNDEESEESDAADIEDSDEDDEDEEL